MAYDWGTGGMYVSPFPWVYTGRRGARRAAGAGRLTAMVGGGRARGEQRTLNMRSLFVTLEMSQLSAWLKSYALCGGSHKQGVRGRAGCGPPARRGGRRAIAVRAACS